MKTTTEKIVEKISSDGNIKIPKKWRDILMINEDTLVEMYLDDKNKIVIKRKIHPLEIEDNLFEGISPFTDEELKEVKESVFPTKKWSKTNKTED